MTLHNKVLCVIIAGVTRPSAAVDRSTSEPSEETAGSPTRQLDRLIHERLRLGIISALAVNASLTFTDLRSMLATTDGNLSVHARKLEEAGYIQCTKSFDGRVPRTAFKLTIAGRKALSRYLDHMEALIHTMRG